MKLSKGFKDYFLEEKDARFKSHDDLIMWLKQKNLWGYSNSYENARAIQERFTGPNGVVDLDALEKASIEDKNIYETSFYASSTLKILWRVFEQLSKLSDNLLPRADIKKALAFEINPYLETDESVRGRNYLNNLEIASYVMEAGFKVIGFDDVIFEHGPYTILVECKRLNSLKNLEARVNKACKQVSKKCDGKTEFPILCISIEKEVNSKKHFYNLGLPGADIQKIAQDMMDRFWKTHGKSIISAKKSIFIGVLIHFKIPVIDKSGTMRIYTQVFTVKLCENPSYHDVGYKIFNVIT